MLKSCAIFFLDIFERSIRIYEEVDTEQFVFWRSSWLHTIITVILRNGILYEMVLHTKYIVTVNLKFQKIMPLGGFF